MKPLFYTAAILFFSIAAQARILQVGDGQPYTRVAEAADDALPGDTILVVPGTYPGGEYIENLQGTSDSWILIHGKAVTIQGGTNAFHFSDPAYVRIEGFTFEGQTGNGVNIDDGGTYDTPAHHVEIRACRFNALNASGNNDQLKLSGLDNFTILNCNFADGSAGGSQIDMVGCHDGVIQRSYFSQAGSNCIQAKGGTRNILITQCRFVDGYQRGINIGGSTGLQFFRPLGANYEAAEIKVYSNIFVRGNAPIAYVGATNCEVINNTIYMPEKWAIRILQETTAPGFLPCGNNSFINNIVVIDNGAASPTINIGPNTAPETFTFANNLWYNDDNQSWNGPNLPVTESDGVLNQDPLLVDPSLGEFKIRAQSPAIAAGLYVDEPTRDYYDSLYNRPRSIGAAEGNPPTVGIEDEFIEPIPQELDVGLYPNPATGYVHVKVHTRAASDMRVQVYSVLGKLVRDSYVSGEGGESVIRIPLQDLPTGMYSIRTSSGASTVTKPILKR
ncbi:MAG: hypothetical protein CL946_11185 [Ectothiorhodospiraceae bacterium]|nr:hypothetical protein [Ectothiorhodospiraceae bacterium]